MNKKHFYQLIRFLIICSIAFFIYLAIRYTFNYIYPFIIVFFLSLLLRPFVNFLQNKWRFPRALAILTVFTNLLLLVVGTMIFIVVEIYQGTSYLADKIPLYYRNFILLLQDFFEINILPIYEKVLSLFLALDSEQQVAIENQLARFSESISSAGANLLENFLSQIPNMLSILPNSLTIGIFIIIATFLVIRDWHQLQKLSSTIIPLQMNQSIQHVYYHLKKAIVGYLKAQFTLVFISGATIYIGLLILGIKHAFTISLFAIVVDFIPFIGTGIIFIPWLFYLFFTGDYTLTIGLANLYMIVVISRQILEPKIVSSNLGIHPLVALIGYFAGIQIWGLLGLIISPFILIFLNACHQAGVFRWVYTYIRG